MVEVDIQFLAGVAVTVFLALLFFGVVVLWDVALALRSVGDKIDKLEDNVDDDLVDIAHALDGLSTAPGGGTQLHLGTGTISSGPATAQGAADGQTPPSTHPEHAASGRPETHGDRGRSTGDQPHPSQEPRAADPSVDPERVSEPGPNDPAAATTRDVESAGTDTADDGIDAEEGTDPTEPDAESDGEPADGVEHPLAERNRGRFVTSPDRTPWYAVSLDLEAMARAGPTIAGELEAGDADRWADGDDEPPEANEVDDEPIAAPPVDRSPEDPDDETDLEEEPTSSPSEPAARADTEPYQTSDEESDAGADELPEDVDEAEAVGADDTSDVRDASSNGEGADEEVDDVADDADDGPVDSDDVTMLSFDDHDALERATVRRPDEEADEAEGDDATDDADDSAGTDESPDEPDEDDVDSDGESESSSALEPRADADSDDVPTTVEDDADGGSASGDADSADDRETETVADESFDAFEFSDPDDEPEERPVNEAVDDLNDDAPSPSLSSHGFEVNAEADDDGAVLVLEFDPETVEITGSTKRLLRYQLRSYADRDTTPDADVTVEGNAIVVELPDADGAAVSRWGDAVVDIVDRTLYLSDNSN